MEITEERVSSASPLYCILVSTLTALFLLVFLWGVPKFVAMYKEMDLGELPLLTKIVLFCYSPLAYVFGVILILGIWKEFKVKDTRRRRALNYAQLALVMVIGIAVFLAMFMPMVQIMERIDK